MFRMNGTPRAQGCAGAVPFSFARCMTQGEGESGNRSRGWPGPCAGAVPFNLAQCVTQGGGENGDRSKGLDLLFSADYADYADYCMRPAWAMRTTAGMQEVEHRE